jgi:hypothetical protein
MASLAIIAFPLAFLSWRFVERPFRNKHRFTKKFITLNAAVITGVLMIIGTLGYTTQGFTNRSMAKAFEALSYNTDALGYLDCKQSFERQHGIRIEYCHTTAKGPINAVIIGDSHADDKFFGIEKNDPNHRWGFIGNTSCPPVLDIAVEADQKNCQEKFARIIEHVANDNAIKIVALSFYGNYFLNTDFAADHIRKNVGPSTVKISSEQLPGASREEIFHYGLEQTIKKLLTSHKTVYLFVDVPEIPFFPQDCLKGKADCSQPREDVLNRQRAHRTMLDAIAAKFPQVRLFDPIELFCDEITCSYKVDENILYRDSHHLTFSGSDALGVHFERALPKSQ